MFCVFFCCYIYWKAEISSNTINKFRATWTKWRRQEWYEKEEAKNVLNYKTSHRLKVVVQYQYTSTHTQSHTSDHVNPCIIGLVCSWSVCYFTFLGGVSVYIEKM